ncbi:MAG: dienelactone hydrolase family protein [Chitinophagaceae bacterium]|nr:dienelactone hydrolase family protein [Chitinophagaceae bacterium]
MAYRYLEEIRIASGNVNLYGDLQIPVTADAVVVFVHGSGSSRFSKRNREVAALLQRHHFGTLLFDLLTMEEDMHYYNRLDIDLLTKRLVDVTAWIESFEATKGIPIGYFGTGTGAAAALQAAAKLPQINAVVSGSGRAHLAIDVLHRVNIPTLLIVGSLHEDILQLNKKAFAAMVCKKKLEIVEGANHLFEEPGKLEIVSELACTWFKKYLLPMNSFKQDKCFTN